jgi:hypothetical protein
MWRREGLRRGTFVGTIGGSAVVREWSDLEVFSGVGSKIEEVLNFVSYESVVEVLSKDVVMFVLSTKLISIFEDAEVLATTVGVIGMFVDVESVGVDTSRERIDSDGRSYQRANMLRDKSGVDRCVRRFRKGM